MPSEHPLAYRSSDILFKGTGKARATPPTERDSEHKYHHHKYVDRHYLDSEPVSFGRDAEDEGTAEDESMRGELDSEQLVSCYLRPHSPVLTLCTPGSSERSSGATLSAT